MAKMRVLADGRQLPESGYVAIERHDRLMVLVGVFDTIDPAEIPTLHSDMLLMAVGKARDMYEFE